MIRSVITHLRYLLSATARATVLSILRLTFFIVASGVQVQRTLCNFSTRLKDNTVLPQIPVFIIAVKASVTQNKQKTKTEIFAVV